MKYLAALILFCNLFLTPAQTNLKKVTLAVHWLPQAQFAGYYIGVQKGIYEKYGFDVKVIHASPSVTSQELLLNGKADFATMFLNTALMLRSEDKPVVNFCQLSQKCGQVLVTEDKTIKEPEDLNGKTIGVWRSGFDEILKAFVKKYNLNARLVPINSTINLFLFGGIDALTTMWYNEYHSVLNAGINKDELNTFFFADYGFDIPEDGLYTIRNSFDKETLDKFAEATIEAWNYAFDHKDEAIELVKEQMFRKHVAFNKPHQEWMLNRMHDLFKVKDKNYLPGELVKDDFDNAYQVLTDAGKIKNSFNYNNFYNSTK